MLSGWLTTLLDSLEEILGIQIRNKHMAVHFYP